MELQGKKINFLGDSITEGCGTSGEAYRFTTLIAEKTGAVCRNYGICATRIARQFVPSDNPRNDRHFPGRVPEMDADADVVVVFGGTNDYGHGDAPIGAMEDRTIDTFYGACHTLCRTLIERYPAATVVIATPLHRLDEGNPCGSCKKQPVAPLIDYVRIIRQVAEYYGLPVMDLYATSGLQPEIPLIQERYVPDGLHPNDAGHVILAEKMIAFLRTL